MPNFKLPYWPFPIISRFDRGFLPAWLKKKPQLMVDPELIIYDTSDPLAAEWRRRIAGASTLYTWVYQPGGPYYTEYVTAYNALTREQRRHVMINSETVWWNIIVANATDAPTGSWSTNPIITVEAARQGVAVPTTMAEYKTLALNHWQALALYSRSGGSQTWIQYVSPGFSHVYEGAPIAGILRAPGQIPSSTNHRRWVRDQTFAPDFDDIILAKSNVNSSGNSLVNAHKYCTGDGITIYNYLPHRTGLEAIEPYWRTPSYVPSTNESTTSQSYRYTDLRYFDAKTTSVMCSKWYELRKLVDPTVTRPIYPIINLSHHFSAGSGFIFTNHQVHQWADSPEEMMKYRILPILKGPYVPDRIYVWDLVRYYWSFPFTNITALSSAEKRPYLLARRGLLEFFFGASVSGGSSVIGNTTPSAHDTWLQDTGNTMTEAYWSTGSTQWWNSGNTSIADVTNCTKLRPYLDFSRAIDSNAIKKAIGQWTTEYIIRAIEAYKNL